MVEELLHDALKILLQFIVIVVAGGHISRYYSKLQKEKEIKQQIVREFSEIFGHFIALRFKANVHLYRSAENEPRYKLVNEEELKQIILNIYNESCDLLGRYQALKPLIHINFSIRDEEIDALHQKYHHWRRSLRQNKPIYQSYDKVNDSNYESLRNKYFKILKIMKDRS